MRSNGIAQSKLIALSDTEHEQMFEAEKIFSLSRASN
jgi:hypothetical protein